jgi:integrase
MASWIPPGQKLLLPWPFDVGTLYHRYKGILRNADLPYDRSHKFHCLRRSTASYFEACGHDATKLLGHSSRKVTLRYLDPRIVGQTNASDVLFRPEGKVG